MKRPFLHILILFSLFCYSQENKGEKCTNGIEKARLDFEKGKAFFDYSRIDIEFTSDGDFENFYQVYMFSKYSLVRDDYVDYKSTKEQCYYAKMDSLIREKYGKDIYLKSRRKAKEIFDYSDRSKKAEILNSSKFYVYFESSAKLIGNDMDII